jgi:hypothetical protein
MPMRLAACLSDRFIFSSFRHEQIPLLTVANYPMAEFKPEDHCTKRYSAYLKWEGGKGDG